jgi:hypothetical protein
MRTKIIQKSEQKKDQKETESENILLIANAVEVTITD